MTKCYCLAAILLANFFSSTIADDLKLKAPTLVNSRKLEGVLFENGLPAGWKSFPTDYEKYICYTVQSEFHSAPRSVKLQSEGNWASIVTNPQRLEKGTRQAASVWLHLPPESPGGALLRIDYLDAANKTIGSSAAVNVSPAAAKKGRTWKYLAVESKADDFPKAARFALVVVQSKTGISYWDDFDSRSFSDEPDPNLLKNGDFESVGGDSFPGWTAPTKALAQVEIVPDTDQPFQGWSAIRLTGDKPPFSLNSERIPRTAGKAYRATGQSRLLSGEGRLKMVLWNGDKRVTELESKLAPSTQWSAIESIHLKQDQSPEATHLTVELNVSGKFDVTLDALRVEIE